METGKRHRVVAEHRPLLVIVHWVPLSYTTVKQCTTQLSCRFVLLFELVEGPTLSLVYLVYSVCLYSVWRREAPPCSCWA